MQDIMSEEVDCHSVQDELIGLSITDFVRFCTTPKRRWDAQACEVVTRVLAERVDDPELLAEAFPRAGDPQRLSDLAILFTARHGTQMPPSVLGMIDFDDAYRNPALKDAFQRALTAMRPNDVRELLEEKPKRRIGLFPYAYDDTLFRRILRESDWKGYVGEAGKAALPAICASFAEDGHGEPRRLRMIASVIFILAREVGPLDLSEQAAFAVVSSAWHETGIMLESSPFVVDVLDRLDAVSARAWVDRWVESGKTDLSARVSLFRFSSPKFQWQAIEQLAESRRAGDIGDLRREVLKLDNPFEHVAGMAKEHGATTAVLKLLRGDVFRHRRHLAKFDALMMD